MNPWQAFHQEGREFFLNLNNVAYIRHDDGKTVIVFSGEDIVLVDEGYNLVKVWIEQRYEK